MASDESHDDIIAEVRAHWQGCEDVSLAELDGRDLLALIDRLKAAHKREIAEQEALKCGAFVEAARKPKRNCDRSGSFDEAWNVFSVEHINAPGEINIAYFASWLFAPCANECGN